MQVKLQVETLVAAIKQPYVLDCEVGSFPSCWAPQQTNTQLFEVDLKSSEVAELVQTLQQQQLEIVKVPGHCTGQAKPVVCIHDLLDACKHKQTATHSNKHCYDTTPSIKVLYFTDAKVVKKTFFFGYIAHVKPSTMVLLPEHNSPSTNSHQGRLMGCNLKTVSL